MPDVRFIWLGFSINKWIIPCKIRHRGKDHPSNVESSGYFKERSSMGHDGSEFSFPSHEEAEGIVVLEALAVIKAHGLMGYSSYTWLDRRDVF